MRSFFKLLLSLFCYAMAVLTTFASPRAWGIPSNCPVTPRIYQFPNEVTDIKANHGGDDVFPFEKVVIPNGQNGAWWNLYPLDLKAYFERVETSPGAVQKFSIELFSFSGIRLGWGELSTVGFNLEGTIITVIGVNIPVKFRSIKNRETQSVQAWVEVGDHCFPVVALPSPKIDTLNGIITKF